MQAPPVSVVSAGQAPAPPAPPVAAAAWAMMSAALRPSTRSAFSPTATPVAFVMKGATSGLGVVRFWPACSTPTRRPLLVWKSKALPPRRLLTRTHGVLFFGSPIAAAELASREDRQP
jgi:hypothetical protein